MIALALSMDVAALLVLGAAGLPARDGWSRTGLAMVAASLALLSIALWLAAAGGDGG
ncbi:hypothetical protein [Spirillospora sp. NPDC029432]|uniref:hypothetical protein n=1 Tax=Spirillospora sp. NPDC029432 TaxID=3154599 RepID=UPI003451F7FD